MIVVSNVCKSFGGRSALKDVSFVLSPGKRIGLVGPNGSGKSTLLRIVAGEIPPDSGNIRVTPTGSIAYLPQYPADELHLSVRGAIALGAGRAGSLRRRMSDLERRIAGAEGSRLNALLAEYGETRTEFDQLDGYSLDARVSTVIEGFGLGSIDQEMPIAALSGGTKTKVLLARVLLSEAHSLLLDEPTNYLDMPSLLWLERWVISSDRSFIIVSHDRRFLDNTVNTTMELHPELHQARTYAGTYSEYADTKRRELDKQWEAYRIQQDVIRSTREDIRRAKEQARGVESTVHSGMGADVQRRRAKKVARKAKTRERRLERTLDVDSVDKPKLSWNLHLAGLEGGRVSDHKNILELRDVRAGYNGRDVLCNVNLHVRGADRIALLGKNGSGKSTLLHCITGTTPCRGTVRLGPSVRTGVLAQENNESALDRTVLQHVRERTSIPEAEARTYLHQFLFSGDAVFQPVRTLSYGERAKLALAILVLSQANFLILDEPTGHLDMPALESIEAALRHFAGPLLVVSHDRAFLDNIGVNKVEVLDQGHLKSMPSLEAYELEIGTEELSADNLR